MQIRVKLMGMLQEHTPPNGFVDLPDDATIEHVLNLLKIPVDSVQVFSVNGSIERDRERPLQDGDELTVLPPVGGG